MWYNTTLFIVKEEFLHSKALCWSHSPLVLLYLFRYNFPFVVSFSWALRTHTRYNGLITSILNGCPLKSDVFASLSFCPTLNPKHPHLVELYELASHSVEEYHELKTYGGTKRHFFVIREDFLDSKAICWPHSPLVLMYLFLYNSPFVVSFSWALRTHITYNGLITSILTFCPLKSYMFASLSLCPTLDPKPKP